MIEKEDVVKIGRFAKPHGIKGELSLVTDFEWPEEGDDIFLICEMDGILVPFLVEESRYKSDAVTLVKLEGVDSEEEARRFVNKEVYFPLEAVDGEVPLGEMTWDNLIGYAVTDTHAGYIGVITDVDDTTANVLLRIDRAGGELLIPAAEELITDADHEARRLVVSLPEGLLDL